MRNVLLSARVGSVLAAYAPGAMDVGEVGDSGGLDSAGASGGSDSGSDSAGDSGSDSGSRDRDPLHFDPPLPSADFDGDGCDDLATSSSVHPQVSEAGETFVFFGHGG